MWHSVAHLPGLQSLRLFSSLIFGGSRTHLRTWSKLLIHPLGIVHIHPAFATQFQKASHGETSQPLHFTSVSYLGTVFPPTPAHDGHIRDRNKIEKGLKSRVNYSQSFPTWDLLQHARKCYKEGRCPKTPLKERKTRFIAIKCPSKPGWPACVPNDCLPHPSACAGVPSYEMQSRKHSRLKGNILL